MVGLAFNKMTNLNSSKDFVGALVHFVDIFVRPPLGQGARRGEKA